jgi:ferritin-like metal-binding protein YciE
MKEIEDADTLDAALIASAQAVEHYEMALYGSVSYWARLMEHVEVAEILEETLAEEEEANESLSDLAMSGINDKANDEGDTDE